MSTTTTANTSLRRPVAQIMTVDPLTANRWLSRNSENHRNARDVVVAKYAADMAAGRWCLTGAPIQFDTNGTLLDGQHRLKAIIKSGVTIPMFVVEGLPAEAESYMDVGAKRTLADQFGIARYPNRAVVAAGARLAFAWATDRLGDRMENLSDAEVREFVVANPSLIDAAAFTKTTPGPLASSAVCAATWRLIDSGHSRSQVHEFFRAIAELRSNGPGDPKHALISRIQRARQVRERVKSTAVLSMIVRAFNAEYLGNPLHRMQLTTEVPRIVAPVEANPQ